jgi:rubrerythrin
MERNNDLTTLEVLTIGVKAEMQAVDLYTRMKEKAGEDDLRDKMEFLIGQEQRHERILRDAFAKQFPDVELKVPVKSVVPTISDTLSRDATMKELFDAAIEAERLAETFYTDLAKKTRDHNSRSLLEYLASMEHSHLSILEAEYHRFELATDQDDDDFLRGDRFMHFGP